MRLTVARVGVQLRSLREVRGLTQTDLAKLAGGSQVSISQIEAGIRIPSLHTLLRLLDALGAEAYIRLKEDGQEDDSS